MAEQAVEGGRTGVLTRIEQAGERMIFESRWILSVFYMVLMVALACLAWKYLSEFVHEFLTGFRDKSNKQLTSLVLNLIDTTLLGNLLLIVIFNGYENFVSKVTCSLGNEDRPRWMGDVDFAGLKLKLLGTLVAISAINLLDVFLQMSDSGVDPNPSRLTWMLVIHAVFVVTGVLFAFSEKIGSEHIAKYPKEREREILLVEDGRRIEEAIRKAQVSDNELRAALRLAGYNEYGSVRYAVLALDGRILVSPVIAAPQ